VRHPFEPLDAELVEFGDAITIAEHADAAIAQDKEHYIELGKMLKQAIDELMDTRAKLGVAEEALFNIENMRPHQLWRESVKDITRDALETIRKDLTSK